MKSEFKNIEELEDKAEKMFYKLCALCERIENLLSEFFPEEKDNIIDVIFQPGDGICVVYEDIKNIPLSNFLKGERI